MITPARVDFPDPLGPISACTSPCRTVRSTPVRMSLPAVDACSSLTSSVALPFVSAIWHLHLHLVVLDLHVVDRHRLGGRQGPGPAGVEIERRPVLRALDRGEVDIDLPLVQE